MDKRKGVMCIFTKALYDKLPIKEIELLHKLNDIKLPNSKLKGDERRLELYRAYINRDCSEQLMSDLQNTKKYENPQLDQYIHDNFANILKQLRTYNRIIRGAQEVSKHMSLHFSEDAYQKAMQYELNQYSHCIRERYINIYYKKELVYQARIDIEFEDFIVELKILDKLQPKNDWQLQAYLDNTRYTKGMLINFNTKHEGNRISIDTRVLIKK